MASAQTTSRVSGTQAIARAAHVLRQLATNPSGGQRLTEVADALELERPTAHRILQALVQEGLAEQDPATRAYRLGPVLLELSLGYEPRRRVHEKSHDSLGELARLTGDCCFLIKQSKLDAVCIARQEGYYPIKAMTLEVGQRRPMGVGAASVAILAALPEGDCEAILERNEQRLIAHSELHGTKLEAIVRATRKQGYSLKPSQALPGVLSMGMAVCNEYGLPVCAISVSTVEQRMQSRVQEVAGMLRTVCRELAKRVRGEPRRK